LGNTTHQVRVLETAPLRWKQDGNNHCGAKREKPWEWKLRRPDINKHTLSLQEDNPVLLLCKIKYFYDENLTLAKVTCIVPKFLVIGVREKKSQSLQAGLPLAGQCGPQRPLPRFKISSTIFIAVKSALAPHHKALQTDLQRLCSAK
jgi:hypothetical protein